MMTIRTFLSEIIFLSIVFITRIGSSKEIESAINNGALDKVTIPPLTFSQFFNVAVANSPLFSAYREIEWSEALLR